VGVAQDELGDENRGTIGLSLVKNLTAQLGGNCELSGEDGLLVRVLFPA
jgi:two-component sensor histidine kinase